MLMFFLGLGIVNQSYAQTITYIFDAGDNSDQSVRVTTNAVGELMKVEYAKKSLSNWIEASLQTVENDLTSYYSYAVVKSGGTGRVYELNIYYYDDKLTETTPEGKTITYWLRK